MEKKKYEIIFITILNCVLTILFGIYFKDIITLFQFTENIVLIKFISIIAYISFFSSLNSFNLMAKIFMRKLY